MTRINGLPGNGAEDQVIHTDPENILIRALLQRRKQAIGGKGKGAKGADKGKRPAEAAADRADAKRSHCEAGPSGVLLIFLWHHILLAAWHVNPCTHEGWQNSWTVVHASGEGGNGRTISFSAEQLRGRTIPELIEILKARGLSGRRGNKEELIQRILDAQERAKKAAQS